MGYVQASRVHLARTLDISEVLNLPKNNGAYIIP
jgi:hypothetical protein